MSWRRLLERRVRTQIRVMCRVVAANGLVEMPMNCRLAVSVIIIRHHLWQQLVKKQEQHLNILIICSLFALL